MSAVGKTCPYCQTPVKPGEAVVFCSACSIPHHQQCWTEGGGCTTFGCRGQASRVPVNNRSNRPIVDIEVEPERTAPTKFCPYSGETILLRAIKCRYCGSMLPDAQMAAGHYQLAAPGPPHQTGSHVRWYPKASSFNRLIASILDGLIVSLAIWVPIFLAEATYSDFFYFIVLITSIWAIWYAFTKDGRENGQSIGKKAMGLMVVNLNTNLPCTRGKSALRALLWIIPYIGGLISLIDCIMVLVSDDGRRIGDYLANTQVIAVSSYPGLRT
jgi:uncharacterized RDD family membrane protein YckC